uniref:Carbohydrate sulfotransferase n=2 Tax=Hirondellea gigas TaxID=1518452 RepID=A0A2P2HZ57_9CRUS
MRGPTRGAPPQALQCTCNSSTCSSSYCRRRCCGVGTHRSFSRVLRWLLYAALATTLVACSYLLTHHSPSRIPHDESLVAVNNEEDTAGIVTPRGPSHHKHKQVQGLKQPMSYNIDNYIDVVGPYKSRSVPRVLSAEDYIIGERRTREKSPKQATGTNNDRYNTVTNDTARDDEHRVNALPDDTPNWNKIGEHEMESINKAQFNPNKFDNKLKSLAMSQGKQTKNKFNKYIDMGQMKHIRNKFNDKELESRDMDQIKTSNNKFSDTEMESIERELEERRLRVKRTCTKHSLGLYRHPGAQFSGQNRYPPTANYDVLYIDRHDGLTWCPVYKAASTSWLHNFCLLAGVREEFLRMSKEQISTVARRVWPPLEYEDAEKVVPETTKFMIVRHPFERLVSAYRDKLENLNTGQEHGAKYFYEAYGKKIVQKYRTSASYNNRTRVRLDTGGPAPEGVEPTFNEFVQYLLHTDLVLRADDHWMPYYLYCTTCYIDYDVIAKFETLDRDQKYLLEKTKLDNKIAPKWLHLTKSRRTSDIAAIYFKTISKSDIIKLYSKYKFDFQMFDYAVQDYL